MGLERMAARGAPEPDYDGAFDATTWWLFASNMADKDEANNEGQLPLDLVLEEELDMTSNPRENMRKRCKWGSNTIDALKNKRCEERFSEGTKGMWRRWQRCSEVGSCGISREEVDNQ